MFYIHYLDLVMILMCYLLQRMLDFMQDDADDVVIDTTDLHKGTGLSVSITHLNF